MSGSAAEPSVGVGDGAASGDDANGGELAGDDSGDDHQPADEQLEPVVQELVRQVHSLARQVAALKAWQTRLLNRLKQLERQVARHIFHDFS